MLLNDILKKIKNLGNSVIFRLILISFIPVIILSSTILTAINYYSDFYYKATIQRQTASLNTIASIMNSSIYEIMQSTFLLASNESVAELLYLEDYTDVKYAYKLHKSVASIANFKNSRDIIEDVFVYNKHDGYVVNSKTIYKEDDYFNEMKSYKLYDLKFWQKTSFDESYIILKPTLLENGKNVLPIICTGMYGVRWQNQIVINIDIEAFSKLLNDMATDDSNRFLIDQEGFIYFSKEQNLNHTTLENKSIMDFIGNDDVTTKIINVGGLNYVFIKHLLETSYFKHMNIVEQIPLNSLFKSEIALRKWIFSSVSIVLIICLGFCIISTKKFYMPIKILLDTAFLNNRSYNKENNSVNAFESLASKFKEMKDENSNLISEVSDISVVMYEKYITKMLKGYEFYDDSEIELYKNSMDMNLMYFRIAIVSIDLKKPFYNDFNKSMQNILNTSIVEVIKSSFKISELVNVLNIDKNLYCIIINTDSSDIKGTMNCLEGLIKSFKNDEEYLDISIGVSDIYMKFSDLNNAYKDANIALSQIFKFSNSKIKLFEKEECIENNNYPINFENKIFNYLISGNEMQITLLIKNIFENNLDNNEISDLCILLKDIGIRSLKQKTIDEFLDGKYKNISKDLPSMVAKNMKDLVLDFLEDILHYNNQRSKIDVKQVLEYIEQNYHQDIYLQKIADIFVTSDKYISRVIKEKTGLSFQQHLSNIRIEKAKDLLKKSDISIKDISQKVGFNNSNTFIRMFTKLEGIAPTQYRKIK